MNPQSTIFCPLCMGNFEPDQKTVVKSFEDYQEITVHTECWQVVEEMPKPQPKETTVEALYSELGTNRTERQMMKRKIERTINKLYDLPRVARLIIAEELAKINA